MHNLENILELNISDAFLSRFGQQFRTLLKQRSHSYKTPISLKGTCENGSFTTPTRLYTDRKIYNYFKPLSISSSVSTRVHFITDTNRLRATKTTNDVHKHFCTFLFVRK